MNVFDELRTLPHLGKMDLPKPVTVDVTIGEDKTAKKVSSSEKEIAQKMMNKGYLYVIVFPKESNIEPLYARTIRMAEEVKNDHGLDGTKIIPITNFLQSITGKKAQRTGSGYRPCSCRDCMEIAIGEKGALCHDCQKAGCSPLGDEECQAPGAYGMSEEASKKAQATPPRKFSVGDIVKDKGTPGKTYTVETYGPYDQESGFYRVRLVDQGDKSNTPIYHNEPNLSIAKSAKPEVTGEGLYQALKKIVDEKQMAYINGYEVDLFSASWAVRLLDALNPANRAKLLAMPVEKVIDIAFKLAK
jgi:hypothetical protein